MNVCAFCIRIRTLLDNPYHYSGAVLARLTVCFATIMWCVVVILQPDALRRWPGAQMLTKYVGEDVYAWSMLFLSFLGIYRLVYHAKPIGFGTCIYGMMALLWSYTFSSLTLAVYSGDTILRPGQISAILAVTLLSLFAFIANPKRHEGG